jgi:recombination protein RecA
VTNKPTVDAAIADIERRWGAGTVMRLGQTTEAVSAVPSGFVTLDTALGIGGYPRGRVIEVFGSKSSTDARTALVLHAVAEAQREGGTVAYVDVMHTFDVTRADDADVDVGALLVSQPDCAEHALEIVETLIRSGGVDLVVVDSVAALVPQAEIEGNTNEHGLHTNEHLGLQARLMSHALRKITSITHRTKCLVIFVNETRQKTSVTFGEVSTGSNALKFYSSVRLDVRRIDDNHARIKVVKNKLAPPFKVAEIEVSAGADAEESTA